MSWLGLQSGQQLKQAQQALFYCSRAKANYQIERLDTEWGSLLFVKSHLKEYC